jgi:hypothetical protein
MDLPLDPTLPLGGIALILTLVWLTGGRHRARIATAGDAAAALAAPEAGFRAAEIAVSADGDAALARDDAGHIAVVFVSGARLSVRRLAAEDIVSVMLAPQPGGHVEVKIATRAFTRPDIALQLAPEAAETWQRHLREAA